MIYIINVIIFVIHGWIVATIYYQLELVEENYMTQNTPISTANEDSTFIYDLIKVTSESDRKLKKFVNDKLFPQKSFLSVESINQNIEALKNMNENQQLLVKARAKHFEEMNDLTKFFPTLIGLFASLVSIYAFIREIIPQDIFFIRMAILVYFSLFFYFTIASVFVVQNRSTAVYFNNLITNIEYKR